MNLAPCPREQEIANLLHAGHWPHASAPEVQAHAGACGRCRDLILLTQSFQGARATSIRAARLQSSGVLWWRAQIRRRHAAYEQIGKPLKAARIFALLVNLLVVASVVVSQARHGLHWLTWSFQFPKLNSLRLKMLWNYASTDPNSNLMLLGLGLGLLALLSVVALYFAAERE